MEEKNLDSKGNSNNNDIKGEELVLDRIQNMEKALEAVKATINNECDVNKGSIAVLGIICIVMVVFGIYFSCTLLNYTIPLTYTWQVFYLTTIRVTISVGLFSLAAYCFKILRSYLHIYQNNRHRKVIVESMASLIQSGEEAHRKVIFEQLLGIIIKFSNTGLLGKESDFKSDLMSKNLPKK